MNHRLLHRCEKIAFWVLLAALLGILSYQAWRVYRNEQKTTVLARQEQEDQSLLLTPSAIFLSDSSSPEDYDRLNPNDELFSTVFEAGYSLLRRCLTDGTATERIRTAELPLQRAACVFVYDYTLGKDLLAEIRTNISEDPNEQGTEIWLFPSESVRDTVQVCLVDWSAGYAWRTELTGNQSTENQTLLRAMVRAASALTPDWTCVRRSFGESLHGNAFVQLQETEFRLAKNYIGNPLETDTGRWNTNKTQQYAKNLLADSDSRICLTENESKLLYTYEGATLSLERQGLIRYTQASKSTDEGTSSLAEDYQVAWSFLSKRLAPNLSAEMELRLTGYTDTENGHLFFFSYFYESDLLLESEERLQENGMTASVEIEIQNGVLRSLRMLPLEVRRRSQEIVTLEESWIEAVDRLWEETPGAVPFLGVSIEDGSCRYVWTFLNEETEEETNEP